MSNRIPATSSLPERPVLFYFFLTVILSGAASVAIRITYRELDPFWVTVARFSVAGLAFWALVVIKKIPIPRGRALLGALIFGILSVGLAFILVAWALVETPASIYQILMALVPLLTLLLSALHGLEAISRRGLFGALLAVVGIAVTVGGGSVNGISWPHIAAIILAAIFMAEGVVLIKRFPPIPPIMTNAIGLTTGAIILAVASLASGEAWTIPSQSDTWIAFLYLAFLVTFFSSLLYMYVLSKWTASGLSYSFVLSPLVTILVASAVIDEKITLNFLIGGALVLAGVLIGALLPAKPKTVDADEGIDPADQVLSRHP